MAAGREKIRAVFAGLDGDPRRSTRGEQWHWESGPPSLARDLRMKFKLPKKERMSPNHSRKISDVLMEFALHIVPMDTPPEIFTNSFRMAVLLWNTPLLPEVAQAENMDRIRVWLAEKQRLDLQFEIARLLELRKTKYGADRRIVMDYTLKFEAKGPYLSVVSLDLDRPENKPR